MYVLCTFRRLRLSIHADVNFTGHIGARKENSRSTFDSVLQYNLQAPDAHHEVEKCNEQ